MKTGIENYNKVEELSLGDIGVILLYKNNIPKENKNVQR
jgi:hypothetical protein